MRSFILALAFLAFLDIIYVAAGSAQEVRAVPEARTLNRKERREEALDVNRKLVPESVRAELETKNIVKAEEVDMDALVRDSSCSGSGSDGGCGFPFLPAPPFPNPAPPTRPRPRPRPNPRPPTRPRPRPRPNPGPGPNPGVCDCNCNCGPGGGGGRRPGVFRPRPGRRPGRQPARRRRQRPRRPAPAPVPPPQFPQFPQPCFGSSGCSSGSD